ncbi:DUF421 domain-containing protein [Caldalkalibacillus salinus]|uniref:DUF421 domain-containing protein n=1 Tax=Caldalkalibacillus salinus TaxID=2803787 RepID=UPI00192316FB|nr:DUF421 domain-containing protein [Caldalkalibacillus salinus]
MSLMEVLLRTAVIFVVLYFLARVLNKKLISQMTFFDFLAGITIGSMTATIIYNRNVRLDIAIAGLVLFCFIVLIIDILSVKSFRSRKVLNSEPTILMKNGKVLEKGLNIARFNIDELLLNLRKKGVFYLDEVEYALLETDGTVSVLQKPQAQYARRQDVQVTGPARGLPEVFIIDGHILPSALEARGKDRQWVTQVLQQQGVQRLEDVIVAQVDALDQVYIDVKSDNI